MSSVEGMNVSFAHAYTVAMAEGHPGNGEIGGCKPRVTPGPSVGRGGSCLGLLVRRRQDLGACEPAHSLAWEPCPEPGNGAASPLFSID